MSLQYQTLKYIERNSLENEAIKLLGKEMWSNIVDIKFIEKIKTLEEKLIKINQLDVIPYYLIELNIDIETEEAFSIIFNNKLTNFYPYIQQIYEKRKAHKDIIVLHYLIFWEKFEELNDIGFRQDDKFNIACMYGKLEYIKRLGDYAEYHDGCAKAIQYNHFPVVQYLFLRKKQRLQYLASQPNTIVFNDSLDLLNYILMVASRYGRTEIVKFAIENGADNITQTGLWAVYCGHLDTLKILMEEIKKTPERIFGAITTWLQGAVRIGNLEIFKYLLSEDAIAYELLIPNPYGGSLYDKFKNWCRNHDIEYYIKYLGPFRGIEVDMVSVYKNREELFKYFEENSEELIKKESDVPRHNTYSNGRHTYYP